MGIAGSGWSTCFARVYVAMLMFATIVWVESRRGISAWISEIGIDLKRTWQLLVLGAHTANANSAGDQCLFRRDSAMRQARPGTTFRTRNCH